MSAPDSYPITGRNKVKRMPERGHYDTPTIHALLDSAMVCHVAYVIDGKPYCTPTLFWRRGNEVIWHGSAASRMLREQVTHIDVCLTVTFLDSIVLTRTAFSHAVNYRSAMLFGRASLIDDPEEKRRTAAELVDTFLPGRSGLVVPPSPAELKQTSFLRMPIDEASAKIRNFPATHEAAEFRDTPVWAGEIPIRMQIGDPVPCATLDPAIPKGPDLSHYHEGACLDSTLLAIRRRAAGENEP
jgi:nitroimidazol reductase NimA-like FMN-containing flavoprotein (pyridoxamine 5'-phosphate oxidase superfamily)